MRRPGGQYAGQVTTCWLAVALYNTCMPYNAMLHHTRHAATCHQQGTTHCVGRCASSARLVGLSITQGCALCVHTCTATQSLSAAHQGTVSVVYAPGCLCCVCRYFLAPQKRQEGETVDAFAARVQDMIAKQVGISEHYLAGLCLLPVWCSLRQCCCWNAEALTTWASQHCPNYCVVTQSRTLVA